ncbi:MAG TPA: hypothetical protein VHX14_19465 [Thermoanaerobaculia bacterium]|jgi:hypothetical protein|nr:hypothetical protein [Thermoanaerobaculia bacterium]
MKRVFVILLILVAYEAVAACRNSPKIRVQFYGCQGGGSGHIKIGNQPFTLDKDGDTAYKGVLKVEDKPFPIDPDYAITISKQVDGQACCAQIPKPTWKDNCTLEYSVYCDLRDPSWGIAASSDEPDVRFSFAPRHPDPDFDGYVCSSRARVDDAANTVANLGRADVVEVKVLRSGIEVARFPVHRSDVESGACAKTKDDLKRINDEAALQANQSNSGATRDYQKTRPPLPGKVTVVMR